MECNQIRIRNFRNVEEADVTFDPGVNILIGANAQGKTNLLESIYYVSVGKSFRANHNGEIIRFGCERSQIDLKFNDGIRDQNIKMTIFKEKKRQAEKNGVRIEMRDKEVDVLIYLVKNRGRVVSPRELYEAVWGEVSLPSSSNTITVHVLNLRRKLEDNPSQPKIIRTVWGKGYQID